MSFVAGLGAAQTLGPLARAYQQKHTPANRTALVRFAAAHPKDREGALALLSLGAGEREDRQSAEAVAHLKQAVTRLPGLADYAAYELAAAESDLRDFESAVKDLEPLWNSVPGSPLAGDAAMLAARAYKEISKSGEAVRVLRVNYAQLPQPSGDLLLAASYRAANDMASSVIYNQRVYYQYPVSPEAAQAAAELEQLKATLGELYPPPTTHAMFQRAEKWTKAGEHARARAEYQAIAAMAGGADREVARVRVVEVDYFRYENISAYANLRALEVSSPEANAERFYYMLEAARRLDRDDQIRDAIDHLAEYPHSTWRLKGLVSAGNRYLVSNQTNLYEPLYRACYESFPEDTQAAYCHWKIAWLHYLQRREDAANFLRDHLAKYPGSDRAPAALYFLGRLAEAAGRADEAKGYYSMAADRFPNNFYSDASQKRMTEPAVFRAVPSESVRRFLGSVVWPVRRYAESFEPTPPTRARLDRAAMLESAGLVDRAERELRFGARTDSQAHIIAMQMARMAGRYDSPHRAMRLMKSLVPGYFAVPLESAPAEFWHLLFPMPYRATMERYAKAQQIDPFMMAALIRQESEFNPDAISSAKAYGLTQIMPATGRQMLKISARRFRPAILLRPEVNLRLGATHLRRVYDSNLGKWEMALAAYNAGGSRVQNWSRWAEFQEPAEFIETIPFSETRNYVFAVLRNEQVYRRVYTPGLLASTASKPVVSSGKAGFKRQPVVTGKKTAGKHPAAKKKTSRRRAAR